MFGSVLYISLNDDDVGLKAKYTKQVYNYSDDSGFDLFIPENQIVKADTLGYTIDHNVKARAFSYPSLEPVPLFLYPRSSISDTPIRMSNSVGIIDSGYRGNIISKVDNLDGTDFKIKQHNRLFQLCGNNLLPFKKIYIVDKNDELFKEFSRRGENGFGSSGK